jgi:phosphoribosylanthranilate isomerase
VFAARDRAGETRTMFEHEHDSPDGMVKVKVCGITSSKDARIAIELGADALGFNFYPPSPRYVVPERAHAILDKLPAGGCNVALFVNEPKEKVREVLACGRMQDGRQAFDALQFHGDESGEYCRDWGLKVIKAFRLKDKESLDGMGRFPADFYLLDSWAPGYGGSGAAFPWDWLEGLHTAKLILAGGLSVENVADAVRRVRPYGVDVCTGVEAAPGVKDHEKLKDFILAAKSA